MLFTVYMNKMQPSNYQVYLTCKNLHRIFFSYLRRLTLGILFSSLRPLKLFLTCSTYFWNDIHIFALFSLFFEPGIIPLDTTFGPFLGGLGGCKTTTKGCWGLPRWLQTSRDSTPYMICVYHSLKGHLLWFSSMIAAFWCCIYSMLKTMNIKLVLHQLILTDSGQCCGANT